MEQHLTFGVQTQTANVESLRVVHISVPNTTIPLPVQTENHIFLNIMNKPIVKLFQTYSPHVTPVSPLRS